MLHLESPREGDRPGAEGEGRQEKEKGADPFHPRLLPRFPLQLLASLFFFTNLVLIFLAGFLSLSQNVRQKQPKHRGFEV